VQLAAAAGCSRFTLHRAFTAAYRMTPADFQRQLRLARYHGTTPGGYRRAAALTP
jgi:AraC-like DNA-binding protein